MKIQIISKDTVFTNIVGNIVPEYYVKVKLKNIEDYNSLHLSGVTYLLIEVKNEKEEVRDLRGN